MSNSPKQTNSIIKCIIICITIASVIFIGIPFICSIVVPIIRPELNVDTFEKLLNGALAIVSIIGTIAGIISLYSAHKDEKRAEKEYNAITEIKQEVHQLCNENNEIITKVCEIGSLINSKQNQKHFSHPVFNWLTKEKSNEE